ncbi:hypothetical protein [Yoonia sp. SS1-5]|uniref:Uncharacterized protein n=1 Tax=Yoonia rhodophyticola TaxID=3137370 RepID=A0AAN0NM22_9RHOB
MANANKQARALIEGRAVRSIDNMQGYKDRMLLARRAIDKAHDVGAPLIFIQDVHRPDLVDFGPELNRVRAMDRTMQRAAE